ncbi:hypothetical protein [Paenibacillus brasilensis]|uniref:Phage protein n=1 Tax=Paenibacillus brasilensis TaxID=128574 RepID=A0ABU0L7K5_9BACL|nr:hypothetical protein [Paenibacillus brasilensis]MDQ0497256.1 hypothetical protein [Paenibacillus brasilensis]
MKIELKNEYMKKMEDLMIDAVLLQEQENESLFKQFGSKLQSICDKHPELLDDLMVMEEIMVEIGTAGELYEIGFKQAISIVQDYGFQTATNLINPAVQESA